MSYILIIGVVLVVVTAFAGPLVLDLMKENNQLRQQSDQADYFRTACENSSNWLVIQDMQARILWANPAYIQAHGLSLDDIIGRNPLEYALPKDQTPSEQDIKNFRFDPDDPAWARLELVKNVRADRTEFWNPISVSFRTEEEGRQNAILVCPDVTQYVNQQEQLRDVSTRLEYEATHNALTGVPNRATFMSFIDKALSQAGPNPVGLLHIDLDNFKNMNDSHGHSAGDAVLVHAAGVVRDTIKRSDLVARVGGDEFVVVCLGMTTLNELAHLANEMIELISEPFEWNNRTIQGGTSIGAVMSQSGSTDADELLVNADLALYEAKRDGRNQVALYDNAMHDHHGYLMRRSANLIDIVDTDELSYYFQSTMDLLSGDVLGFATLVRWEHTTDGVIPPNHFLPLAKDLGLLVTLDLSSMAASLKEKRRLSLAGFPDINIAFNAFPELLAHPEFINRLIWGVEAGGINRGDITIEVLETTDFGNINETKSNAAIISDLCAAGFQGHLNDFGVGFAGLSHLATLDVTGVKVDRSLIKEIRTDETSEKIVRKIIELSNDLEICVISEASKTKKQPMPCRTWGAR